MKLHLQHLQFGTGKTRFELAFVQSARTGLAGILPQMKAKHDADKPPCIVDEETAQRGKKHEWKRDLHVRGDRLRHHKWKHKWAYRAVDEDENRKKNQV